MWSPFHLLNVGNGERPGESNACPAARSANPRIQLLSHSADSVVALAHAYRMSQAVRTYSSSRSPSSWAAWSTRYRKRALPLRRAAAPPPMASACSPSAPSNSRSHTPQAVPDRPLLLRGGGGACHQRWHTLRVRCGEHGWAAGSRRRRHRARWHASARSPMPTHVDGAA